jgi:hypothetical protein
VLDAEAVEFGRVLEVLVAVLVDAAAEVAHRGAVWGGRRPEWCRGHIGGGCRHDVICVGLFGYGSVVDG